MTIYLLNLKATTYQGPMKLDSVIHIVSNRGYMRMGFFFLHQTYIHSMRHTEDILISFEQRGLISFEQFLAKTKV